MTKVLLTVDAALAWGPHARGASWQENLALSFDPAGVGVPWQLDRLRDHGLKACFFVDPMPALIYGIEPVRRMVEPILAAGQEVQLLLHPVWQSVAEGVAEGARFELTCYDAEDQLDLIETARDLLVEAGAPSPVAFRSGGYAADVRTLAALVRAGLRFDSSHGGGSHSGTLPFEPDLVGPADLGELVEVPVTRIADTAAEAIEKALRHALRAGHELVALAGRSFDLASRGGGRPDLGACRRFERLCAFLAAQAATLPTVHFSDLDAAAAAPPPRAWPNALYQHSL
ncbi:MAG TPA: polysaccharide deacetylase [Allosphingosinicella sp.]